jgi:hypothetical protein
MSSQEYCPFREAVTMLVPEVHESDVVQLPKNFPKSEKDVYYWLIACPSYGATVQEKARAATLVWESRETF